MSPDVLKLFFRLAIFILLSSSFMVLVVPKNSAEFVVSVLSLVVGTLLMILVILVNIFGKK